MIYYLDPGVKASHPLDFKSHINTDAIGTISLEILIGLTKLMNTHIEISRDWLEKRQQGKLDELKVLADSVNKYLDNICVRYYILLKYLNLEESEVEYFIDKTLADIGYKDNPYFNPEDLDDKVMRLSMYIVDKILINNNKAYKYSPGGDQHIRVGDDSCNNLMIINMQLVANLTNSREALLSNKIDFEQVQKFLLEGLITLHQILFIMGIDSKTLVKKISDESTQV